MVAIGDRFTVKEAQEFKNPKGRLLARYIPGLGYTVTPTNLAFVAGLAAEGKIETGSQQEAARQDTRRAARAGKGIKVAGQAGKGRLKGVIDTGPAKI